MRTLIALLFGFPSLAQASTLTTQQILSDFKCPRTIQSYLNSEMAWLKVARKSDGQTFKALNEKTGHWVILSKLNKGFAEAWIEKDGDVQLIKVDPKCDKKESAFKADRFKPLAQNGIANDTTLPVFDDGTLKKLIQGPKLSLIYVWSPGMVYSCHFHDDFKKSAKKLSIQFVSVVDPTIPTQQLKDSVVRCKVGETPKTFLSNELYLRGALEHMPMSFLVGKGKLWGGPIIGAMDKNQISQILERKLGLL